MIKSIGLAASLTFVVLAVLVAAPATAYQVESCLESEECETASVGTTYEGSAEKFVIENEEKEIVDECELSLKGKVIDPSTEKEGDPMELSVTSAKFTGCAGSSIEAGGLPWIAAADAVEYESLVALEYEEFEYKRGSCVYNILNGIFHHVLEKSTTINRVRYINVKGTVGKVGAPTFFCPKLLKIDSTIRENLISDPGSPEATYITIS